ncbi:MAG: hypothetical protein ACPG40_13210, partial [Alphaproteobacteria bacterium]
MIRTLAILSTLWMGLFVPIQGHAQKSAFTAEGERVYLYDNGSWSTDPDREFSDLLEMELQQKRASESSEDRCTLIFGLHNGFAVH